MRYINLHFTYLLTTNIYEAKKKQQTVKKKTTAEIAVKTMTTIIPTATSQSQLM